MTLILWVTFSLQDLKYFYTAVFLLLLKDLNTSGYFEQKHHLASEKVPLREKKKVQAYMVYVEMTRQPGNEKCIIAQCKSFNTNFSL